MTVTVTVKVPKDYKAKVRQAHQEIVKVGPDESVDFTINHEAHDTPAQDSFDIEVTYEGDPVSETGERKDGAKGHSPRGNKGDIAHSE